jgi:large subunit ribosomal protein L7/L12
MSDNTFEVPAKFADLIKKIEEMSVVDLNELVKAIEGRFGVSAAAAVAAPAAAGPAGEEKSSFTVHLADGGAQKIAVIKVVKELLGLGLKEAKDLVDAAPSDLKANVKKEEAEAIKAQVEAAGGMVALKSLSQRHRPRRAAPAWAPLFCCPQVRLARGVGGRTILVVRRPRFFAGAELLPESTTTLSKLSKPLVAVVATLALLLALAAAAGAASQGSPAAAAAALSSSDKAQAQALVSDLRDALDAIGDRATDVADTLANLKVESGSRASRDKARAEVRAIAADLSSLDTNLKALDLRVATLVPGPKRATGTASATVDVALNRGTGFRVTCDVGDRTVGRGDPVLFSALATGGATPYAYKWTGAFSGNASSQKASFVAKGSYRETVTVTDKNGKKAADDCPKVEVDDAFDADTDDGGDRAKNAKISVIAPAAGARLAVGTSTAITWKTAGLASRDLLDVTLSDGDDGVTYYVASSVGKGDGGAGSLTWRSVGTVASAFLPIDTYTLRVCTTDGEVCGAAKVNLVRP